MEGVRRKQHCKEPAVKIQMYLLSALLVLMTVSATYGQVASRVSGTIRDATDAVMPNVSVTLEEVDKGTTETATTNEAGRYAFPTVKVGTYRVSAAAAG